jgi:hypothetical protein
MAGALHQLLDAQADRVAGHGRADVAGNDGAEHTALGDARGGQPYLEVLDWAQPVAAGQGDLLAFALASRKPA